MIAVDVVNSKHTIVNFMFNTVAIQLSRSNSQFVENQPGSYHL